MFKIAAKIADDTPLTVLEVKKLCEWLSFNINHGSEETDQLPLPIEKEATIVETDKVSKVTSPFEQPADESHPGEREFRGGSQC